MLYRKRISPGHYVYDGYDLRAIYFPSGRGYKCWTAFKNGIPLYNDNTLYGLTLRLDKARKLAIRRRAIIGTVIEDRIKRGLWSYKRLMSILDEDVTDDQDRCLFGLPSLVATPSTQETQQDG